MCYLFVNISGSCQLRWHRESNGHQSCHTVTLSDDVKENLMSFKNNNVHSPNKPECLNFQKFQPFIPKYPLKHQYLPEKSYVKTIPTICSIH